MISFFRNCDYVSVIHSDLVFKILKLIRSLTLCNSDCSLAFKHLLIYFHCIGNMVLLTLLARVTDGLPLSASIDNSNEVSGQHFLFY